MYERDFFEEEAAEARDFPFLVGTRSGGIGGVEPGGGFSLRTESKGGKKDGKGFLKSAIESSEA